MAGGQGETTVKARWGEWNGVVVMFRKEGLLDHHAACHPRQRTSLLLAEELAGRNCERIKARMNDKRVPARSPCGGVTTKAMQVNHLIFRFSDCSAKYPKPGSVGLGQKQSVYFFPRSTLSLPYIILTD
jgi:hypothetical protein